ncbi:hypothetical protein [Sphingomonas natans]|nr:hypothetical protein [Sphingomonas sp. BIUV-7]
MRTMWHTPSAVIGAAQYECIVRWGSKAVIAGRVTAYFIGFVDPPCRHLTVSSENQPGAIDLAADQTLRTQDFSNLSSSVRPKRRLIAAVTSEIRFDGIGDQVERTHKFDAAILILDCRVQLENLVTWRRQRHRTRFASA